MAESENLATLSNLDEATLLEELRHRYSQNKIYVRLASYIARSSFKPLGYHTDLCG